MAAPLRALARGTRAVARGDFTQVHTVSSRDELGMLTQSFNRMTRQLADARAAAVESHDKLLEANAYLEGVLSGVTAGVVTLEHDLSVRISQPDCQHHSRPAARRTGRTQPVGMGRGRQRLASFCARNHASFPGIADARLA